jgi:hypothetical protein
MSDELEQLRREVERLTAERDQARAELSAQGEKYRSVLAAYGRIREREIRQADLDEARTSGATLQTIIDQLRGGGTANG